MGGAYGMSERLIVCCLECQSCLGSHVLCGVYFSAEMATLSGKSDSVALLQHFIDMYKVM